MRAARIVVVGALAAFTIAGSVLVRAGQQGVGQAPSQFPLAVGIRERGSAVPPALAGCFYAKDGGAISTHGHRSPSGAMTPLLNRKHP